MHILKLTLFFGWVLFSLVGLLFEVRTIRELSRLFPGVDFMESRTWAGRIMVLIFGYAVLGYYSLLFPSIVYREIWNMYKEYPGLTPSEREEFTRWYHRKVDYGDA